MTFSGRSDSVRTMPRGPNCHEPDRQPEPRSGEIATDGPSFRAMEADVVHVRRRDSHAIPANRSR